MASSLEDLRTALADRYRIERQIGQGGMSTVYLADDLRHHRRVAVKVLQPDLAAALGPERFLREIEIAAQLNHPHILAMLDSGDADGLLYYVMPLVEGESLASRLHREKQLPIEEAVWLARELADGLGAAHAQGVVHRDIKPDNVLLSSGHAVLADFGIARAVSVVGGEKLTQTGIAVGTPAYMAPEQATGTGEVDPRTDLYALGCVLYEMLAGEAPFTGPTPMAVMARHSLERVPSIRIVRQTVPEGVEAVIEKAMAKVPVDRYATAADMAEALDTSLREDPGDRTATVPSRADTAQRGFRVPVMLVGWSAIALVVILGAGVWSRWGRSPSRLDANLIAVAPFTAFDSSLDTWSQGIEAGLSRNLDGFGPLHALAPTSVIREGVDRIDAATAITIGRQSGAGVVVFGSLTPLGTDSVQGRVTVMDVQAGEPIGDVWAGTELGRMNELVDSISIGIVDRLADGRRLGAGQLSGLSSRSVPAVKAFLRGEQEIRRAAFDSAVTSYHEALKADSLIALGYYRIGLVRGLSDYQNDSLYYYLSRAGTMNHGLSRHDSMLVESGACIAAIRLGQVAGDSLRRERADQCRALALEMTIVFPDDAEAWSALGLVRRELSNLIDVTAERGTALATFDSALVKDPGYGLLYSVAIRQAIETQEYASAWRLAKTALTLDPPDRARATFLLLAGILDPEADPEATDRLLDSLPSCELERAAYGLLPLTDSAETTIRIGRSLLGDRTDARCYLTTQSYVRRYLAAQLIYRGHLREALETVGTEGHGWFSNVFPELALWGGVPPQTADSVFGEWLTRDPWKPIRSGVYFAAWWWARQGDSTSITEYLRRSPHEAGPVWSAFLALARRDTSEALREFSAATEGSMHYWRLVWAELLIANDRHGEAFEVLRGTPSIGWPTLTKVYWWLERGRLAERLGEDELAITLYQLVVDAWVNADESQQGYVAEARSALHRLGS